MRRRDVLLASGYALLSRVAHAQHRPQVGFLHPGSAAVGMRITAVREGLAASAGTASDAVIVPALAEGQLERLPSLAADLAARSVDVICAVSPPAVLAALKTAPDTPVVAMDLESDPIANGWANSLARPGRKLTGVFLDLPDFTAKCVQLLREAVPGLKQAAVFWHPASGDVQKRAAESAAAGMTIKLTILTVAQPSEFASAFEAAVQSQSDGVLMLSSPLFGGHPQPLADLALRARIPTVNQFPDFAESGGFLAYGPELQDLFRQAGRSIGRVLNGTPVGEIPIERPTRFRLVINLKTAGMLGVDVPPSILARADEVIE